MAEGDKAAGSTESTHLRLNQLAPLDGGGGASAGPDLASSPAQKKAAANLIEKHLEPDTHKAGTQARENTGAVAKEFGPQDGEGWLTAHAVKTARDTWSDQLTTLLNRLGGEKAALRSTSTLFQNTDTGVDLGIRKSSVLDSF